MPDPHKPGWLNFREHFAIALIVAGFVIPTFESIAHRRREQAFAQLFNSLEETIERITDQFSNKCYRSFSETLTAYHILFPEEVFKLLKDIALQVKQIPTLYDPPRDVQGEYTFANNIEYFNNLTTVHRNRIVEVLREWIYDDHPNVKFLASDFIGRYRISELAPLLLNHAGAKYARWEDVDTKDRDWIMNYIWAYSRCENPMYASLERELCKSGDPWTERWILFVPLQMPDKVFIGILKRYIELKDELSSDTLKALGAAVNNLCWHYNGECEEILNVYSKKFPHEMVPEHVTIPPMEEKPAAGITADNR
jgi:hypothetical protein